MATVSKSSLKVKAAASSLPYTVGADEYVVGQYRVTTLAGGDTVALGTVATFYFAPGSTVATTVTLGGSGTIYTTINDPVIFQNS